MTHEMHESTKDRILTPQPTDTPGGATDRSVEDVAEPVAGIDYDEVLEETFPASDPPPGPATLPKRLVTNALRRAPRPTNPRS